MFTRVIRCTNRFNYRLPIRFASTVSQSSEPTTPNHTSRKKKNQNQSQIQIPHHDLKSYISYANLNNVNRKSTVFRGTLYEYSVQKVLSEHLGFDGLIRSGKAGDKGVDLLGNWNEVLALIQCKSSTVKTGARLFREMAGVYNIFINGTGGAKEEENENALIIIASPASITSQGMKEFLQLSIPIIYFKISFITPIYNLKTNDYDYGALDNGTALQSILYNNEANKLLLNHGIKFNKKYSSLEPSNSVIVPKLTSNTSLLTNSI